MIDHNRLLFGNVSIPISDSYKNSVMLFLNKHTIE